MSIQRSRPTLIAILLCGFSIGCGSPQGSSADDLLQSVDPAPTQDTALASNVITNNFDFDQFLAYDLSYDLSEQRANMAGEYIAVKVFDEEQNQYFVGRLADDAVLQARLNLPRHVKLLWLEIFSNAAADGVRYQEVPL